MNTEEITILGQAYEKNYSRINDYGNDEAKVRRQSVALLSTAIDYLRGDIEGLPSPLSELARNEDSSCPAPPPDNGDPSPLSTEVMKCLGSLGLQALKELKGYKYDDKSHILLHVNGRLANSGWLKGDPHLCELECIMAAEGTPFPLLP